MMDGGWWCGGGGSGDARARGKVRQRAKRLPISTIRIPILDSDLCAIITLKEEDGGATTTTRGKEKGGVVGDEENERRERMLNGVEGREKRTGR
jgi:hypothetical protein